MFDASLCHRKKKKHQLSDFGSRPPCIAADDALHGMNKFDTIAIPPTHGENSIFFLRRNLRFGGYQLYPVLVLVAVFDQIPMVGNILYPTICIHLLDGAARPREKHLFEHEPKLFAHGYRNQTTFFIVKEPSIVGPGHPAAYTIPNVYSVIDTGSPCA